MPNLDISPFINNSIETAFNKAVEMHNQENPDDKMSLMNEQMQNWKQRFIDKIIIPATEEKQCTVNSDYDGKDPLFFAELWCRYVQQNIYKVVGIQKSEEDNTTLDTHEKRLANTPRRGGDKGKPRIYAQNVSKFLPEEICKKVLKIPRASYSIEDLSTARLWFKNNNPIKNESTPELYVKRYDQLGIRDIHTKVFSSLIPRDWKKSNKSYKKVDLPAKEVRESLRWFSTNDPIKDETTWELYLRYDPEGEKRMNLGSFNTLVPDKWKEIGNYNLLNATYDDCVLAKEWFSNNHPIEGETTVGLCKRFLKCTDKSRKSNRRTKEKRTMHMQTFCQLIPKEWRDSGQYSTDLNASFKEAEEAEEWFEKHNPIKNESTIELYRRFHFERSGKSMNPQSFSTLIPRKKFTGYAMLNSTYDQMLKMEQWFDKNKYNPYETTWELFSRFLKDQKGRKCDTSTFWGSVPSDWRNYYGRINILIQYDVYLAAKQWMQNNPPQQQEELRDYGMRFYNDTKIFIEFEQFYKMMPYEMRNKLKDGRSMTYYEKRDSKPRGRKFT